MSPADLTLQVHLSILPSSASASPFSETSHSIYSTPTTHYSSCYCPGWLQSLSSIPTAIHSPNSHTILVTTCNGQLIILQQHPQQTQTQTHYHHSHPHLHSPQNPLKLTIHSNHSTSTSRPNLSNTSPSIHPPNVSTIYSNSSASSSRSSIHSLHSICNIKASPTVSISISNNLIPTQSDDHFSVTHSPPTPQLQSHHHHPSDSHHSSQPSKSLSHSQSNRSHSPSNIPSWSPSRHPQSPTSSTYSYPRRPRNSLSHPFESLWQGSSLQTFRSPTTAEPPKLEPPIPSSDQQNQPILLPSPVFPSSYSPSSAFSFCASTLISPLGYADPILSIKFFQPCNDRRLSSWNEPSDPVINDVPNPHVANYPGSTDKVILTLTKFGKCSKVSSIDGHIIQSIDLCESDGLVTFEDWCVLADSQDMMSNQNSDPDKKLPTQEGPLILCLSSTVQPVLLDSLDFRILPTIFLGSPIEKSRSFYKTKVFKQSKISNNHWSINLISLTWSKELLARELNILRDLESTSNWRIDESSESILLKTFGDELDLEEQVEIVVDRDRFAIWSPSQFWILDKSSISNESNLDRRIYPTKTETNKKITDSNDLIVSLSFLDSFGVVIVSKKQVKLFRSFGMEPLPTGWSEWKLASIEEARFTLEDPYQFEFATSNSSLPSTMDNQVAIINALKLLTVEIDPSTGQRRLSELSFTTEPPSNSTSSVLSDPDPDATVTLLSTKPHVYHRLRDLYLSTPIIQPNQPPPTCLTCSIWLPDDFHPAILVGDSAGQISIYSLNIASPKNSTVENYWKLEHLKKEDKIGGPISSLYADEQWVIAGGVSGDIGIWSRKIKNSLAPVCTAEPPNEFSYRMELVNQIILGTVPVQNVCRLPDLDIHITDGEDTEGRVSRFVCLMMDGSIIVLHLNEIGLIDIEGELLPIEPTIGISELWSNGPEMIVFYREKHLGAQRWLSSKGLSANLGRQEAQTMIQFENSQLGLKWSPIELSNCRAQSGGSQLSTSRVFNVYGLPAFNVLSVKLRDFVESIGLQEGPALSGRLSMVRMMISQLFPWGLDLTLDNSVEHGLGIGKPSNEERIQNLNVINGDHDERMGMTLYMNHGNPTLGSDYEKTYRLLNLVVLLRVFLNEACYERHASETIVGLARLATNNTNHPSDHSTTVWLDLKILIKYWLDPSVEVREAARLLIGIRLGSMSKGEIEDLVLSWEGFLPIEETPSIKTENVDWTFGRKTNSAIQQDLPKTDGIDNKQKYIREEKQINAMLLIGLIVSERYKLLPSKVLKDVSMAVFQAVSPFHKSSRQLKVETLKAGLEICCKTFEIIQNYIDAIELVRNLFGWATGKDGEISGELKGMAKYTCLHVASVNTPLFMTTLSYDLMISHNPNDRISTMKLVVFMVRKRPLVLHASLPRLLEAVVKSLDPTQKQMRAQTQTGATVILHELVKTYPSIAFHGPSQKLAIGTPEGAIIIYDLKTSTKIHILESFRKPVTACSFSTDGQRLVSVSLDENRIEIWKFNNTPFAIGSLFKFTSSNTSTSTNTNTSNSGFDKSIPNSTSSTGPNGMNKPFKSFSFNVGEEAMMSIAGTLEWIRIDWLNHRSCRLRIRESSITFSC